MFYFQCTFSTKVKHNGNDPTSKRNPHKLPHPLLLRALHRVILILPHTPTPHSPSPPLLRSTAIAHDVPQQRVRSQVHAVVRASDRRGDVLGGLRLTPHPRANVDATQLDEARVVLHSLTDQTRRRGFSFSANDRRLLVLLRLLHHVLGALRLLLGYASPPRIDTYPPAWLRRRW